MIRLFGMTGIVNRWRQQVTGTALLDRVAAKWSSLPDAT
jgi:hypothetical protein